MQITVKYMAQLKQAAGVDEENVDLEDGNSLENVIRRIAEQHDDSFRRILLTDAGQLQPAILYFIGDEQIEPGSGRELRDAETLTVLAPMAGGCASREAFSM